HLRRLRTRLEKASAKAEQNPLRLAVGAAGNRRCLYRRRGLRRRAARRPLALPVIRHCPGAVTDCAAAYAGITAAAVRRRRRWPGRALQTPAARPRVPPWRCVLAGMARVPPPPARRRTPAALPLLTAAGGVDPVGHFGRQPRALATAYENDGQQDVSMHIYDRARHELHNDAIADAFCRDLQAWFADRGLAAHCRETPTCGDESQPWQCAADTAAPAPA